MPVRRRTGRMPGRLEVDAESVFRWSAGGDGLDHLLGDPCYRTRDEAQRAWRRVRRPIWAVTPRFTVPRPAEVFDGLTTRGREFVLSTWNHVPPFDLRQALDLLAEDRHRLEQFAMTRGGRTISDYLQHAREDFDVIEAAARALGAEVERTRRSYPAYLSSGTPYGGLPRD